MAKAIFVGGTSSNVGKSWVSAGLCRLAFQRGIKVAPFKGLSGYIHPFTWPGGGKINFSQAVQAEACNLLPETGMNPVLIQSVGQSDLQIYVHGQIWKTIAVKDYPQHVEYLRNQVIQAYESLASKFDLIVIEGTGSVAESSLIDTEYSNLSLAQIANAQCLLVTNGKFGGVPAAILGTLNLLPLQKRSMIGSFLINRYQENSFSSNYQIEAIEKQSGIQCLGKFPQLDEIDLPSDYSESLKKQFFKCTSKPEIAIVRFPHISNTTDFRLLHHADWLTAPVNKFFPYIILPGTRSVFFDYEWFQRSGFKNWLLDQYRNGAFILGIGGGCQMLGEEISIPQEMEGMPDQTIAGLGLLPIRSILNQEPYTRTHHARTPSGIYFDCYEVSSGRTEIRKSAQPFAILENSCHEGIVYERVAGTYLHGALESESVIEELFGCMVNFQDRNSRRYDALAGWLEKHASPAILNQLISGRLES